MTLTHLKEQYFLKLKNALDSSKHKQHLQADGKQDLNCTKHLWNCLQTLKNLRISKIWKKANYF